MIPRPGAGEARPFPAEERALLLAMPQIGPAVVARLEAAGFHSLQMLQDHGVDAAVEAVCRQLGSRAWSNRRRALRRALGRGVCDPASRTGAQA